MAGARVEIESKDVNPVYLESKTKELSLAKFKSRFVNNSLLFFQVMELLSSGNFISGNFSKSLCDLCVSFLNPYQDYSDQFQVTHPYDVNADNAALLGLINEVNYGNLPKRYFNAAQRGYIQTLEYALNTMKVSHRIILEPHGVSLLYMSLQNDQFAVATWLLHDYNWNVSELNYQPYKSCTWQPKYDCLLSMAVANNQIQIATRLLETVEETARQMVAAKHSIAIARHIVTDFVQEVRCYFLGPIIRPIIDIAFEQQNLPMVALLFPYSYEYSFRSAEKFLIKYDLPPEPDAKSFAQLKEDIGKEFEKYFSISPFNLFGMDKHHKPRAMAVSAAFSSAKTIKQMEIYSNNQNDGFDGKRTEFIQELGEYSTKFDVNCRRNGHENSYGSRMFNIRYLIREEKEKTIKMRVAELVECYKKQLAASADKPESAGAGPSPAAVGAGAGQVAVPQPLSAGAGQVAVPQPQSAGPGPAGPVPTFRR